jgi:hypothetical protein
MEGIAVGLFEILGSEVGTDVGKNVGLAHTYEGVHSPVARDTLLVELDSLQVLVL